MGPSNWVSLLELPFLLLGVVFAFITARALRGGAFGVGMMYIAIGTTIMGVGHLSMTADSLFHFNLFNSVFGSTVGPIVFVVALILTWGFTGYGFYRIYRASRPS
ncbi:MAG TPA: hypothetical protein VHM28_11705 [Anaerolineales bacterium]|jgi:F0F1-type ATP synthase membrane subunit c/vacuolar-type H+-ATPase subunit K|nr:hypothetical protein [Anaerolineales bacterium]